MGKKKHFSFQLLTYEKSPDETGLFVRNRQDCTHCRFYLKDTPFQNDTAKLQLFQKPTRGWRKFYCNELSLVVCFTRITVNVPRIVINCFGDIASGCRWLQQPCHACMGLCGGGHLWLRPIIVIRLSMKTRHCISRCDESSRKSEFRSPRQAALRLLVCAV